MLFLKQKPKIYYFSMFLTILWSQNDFLKGCRGVFRTQSNIYDRAFVYGQKSPIEDVRLGLKMLFRKFPVVRIHLKQLLCSYCFPIAPTHSLHGLHFVDDCCGNVYDVGSGFRSLYADIITQKFTIWSYTEPCQISKMSF